MDKQIIDKLDRIIFLLDKIVLDIDKKNSAADRKLEKNFISNKTRKKID